MDNFRRIFYTEDELLSNALELPTSNYSNIKIKRLYLPSNVFDFIFNAKILGFYDLNNVDIALYIYNTYGRGYIRLAFSKNSSWSIAVWEKNTYIYDPNTAGFVVDGSPVINSFYYYFGTDQYDSIVSGAGIPATPFYYICDNGNYMESDACGVYDNNNDWYVCIDFTNCYGSQYSYVDSDSILTAYIKFLTITRSGSKKVYYEPYTS